MLTAAPSIFYPSHARADEITRAISAGECSDEMECQDQEAGGILLVGGVVVGGLGFYSAAVAIAQANDPKRKKAKAQGPKAYARYLKIVERAQRIAKVREERLKAERKQRQQTETEQLNNCFQAEQIANAAQAQRTKIERADKRIKQQRAKRIEGASRTKKGNAPSPRP